MTFNELHDKRKRLRSRTDTKQIILRDHSRLLDQAFEELKEVHDDELDLIYEKIRELDERMNKDGLRP